MNTDATFLEGILAFIGAISQAGRRKMEERLKNVRPRDRAILLEQVRRADALAWWWQGSWVEAARAWLFVKLVLDWISGGDWAPPLSDADRKREVDAHLGWLRNAAEGAVRNALMDLVTSRALMRMISEGQRDASRDQWDPALFTDPRSHSPAKFRYLIHALRLSAGIGTPTRETQARFDYLRQTLGPYLNADGAGPWGLRSAEMYLREPAMLLTELLSCSIIDQAHPRTYGNFAFGFILEVPKGNICMASTVDLAINNARGRADMLVLQTTPLDRILAVEDFLEPLAGMYARPLQPPGTVLAGTRGHNEVLVLGAMGGARVRVVGIFVKVIRGRLWESFAQEDLQHGLGRMIRECSRSLAIPIVPIPDDAGTPSDVPFDEWAREADPRPASALRVGNTVSVYQDADVTSEYDMAAIRGAAQLLLQQGSTPDQVHRRLHDDDGIPHAVCERVLNLLGHRDYL
jgi:hypothetical protein